MRLKKLSVLIVAATAISNVTYSQTSDYQSVGGASSPDGKSYVMAELALYDSIAGISINADSMLKYATLEFELSQKLNRPNERASALRYMGVAYSYKWEIDKAYANMSQALELYTTLNDTLSEAQCCEWLGRLLSMRGANANAVGFLNRSLELYKQSGHDELMSGVYRLMGLQCLDYKIYDRAYEYFGQARGVDKRFGSCSGEAEDMYCLGQGQLYQCIDEEGSLSQLLRAKGDLLAAYKSIDTSRLHAVINIYKALADAYLEQSRIDKPKRAVMLDSCHFFIEKGYRCIEQTGAVGYKMMIDLCESRYQMERGNYKSSVGILRQLEKADEEGTLTAMSRDGLYLAIAEYYGTTGNYQKASLYARKVGTISRRKNNDGYLVNSAQTKIQTEFDEEMRQRDMSEREREQVFKERSEQFVTIIVISVLLIIILLLLIVVIYHNNVRRRRNNALLNEQNRKLEQQQIEILKQNKLLNQKTEEILHQRDEIEGQRNYLSSQNKLISNANRQLTDSLLYAKKIQEASVPSQDMMNGFFGNCLVFWRPLNIVSGDFYWAVQVGNYKFLAVADCTGHGVPGAFMSMLGITLLNDIVMHENVAKLTAARVLDSLRAKLKEALRQTGRAGEAADGIDLAFCIFNTKSTQMQYAGAFRPLIIVRNNEIVEYKADKMPCGVYINESPRFTNNIIDLQSGDVLYMYSDGIADQFSGGPDLRKFTIRRLKEMLVEVNQKPFDQQKLLIAKTIDDWRKPPQKIGKMSAQVDDILLIGLRIK